MRTFILPTILCLIGAGLQSCASTELNQRLDEKVARESTIKSRKDLDAKAAGLMINTPGLSDQQRERMKTMKTQLQAKLKALNGDSLKLRALLIQDVLSPGNPVQEINEVKKRLRKNSQARIDAIFSAVDEANDVLGRNQLIEEAMDLQEMQDDSQY
ncbi:MAG: hypothetical protein ACXVB9_15160 [Bdellovibrionota bacterium]